MAEKVSQQRNTLEHILESDSNLSKIYQDFKSSGYESSKEYDGTKRMREFNELADAIRFSLPAVPDNHVRLWRGNRHGEVGSNPSYTNSLEGIALPFLARYAGVLAYVDVPNDIAAASVSDIGAAVGSEFILPADEVRKAKVVGVSEEESNRLKSEAKGEESKSETDDGWGSVPL